MTKHLNRKVGEMTYDKLIAGISPAIHVSAGTIRKLSAEGELKRGTVLAKSSIDNKLVILGTNAASAVDAVAATYAQTADEAVVDGKTYYTENAGVYTAVADPQTADINTYYEMTDPGSPAVPAEVLVVDSILCDDVVVGTAADAKVPVYTAGNFNLNALIVHATHTITEAEKDKLRERGIYLGVVLE